MRVDVRRTLIMPAIADVVRVVSFGPLSFPLRSYAFTGAQIIVGAGYYLISPLPLFFSFGGGGASSNLNTGTVLHLAILLALHSINKAQVTLSCS